MYTHTHTKRHFPYYVWPGHDRVLNHIIQAYNSSGEFEKHVIGHSNENWNGKRGSQEKKENIKERKIRPSKFCRISDRFYEKFILS